MKEYTLNLEYIARRMGDKYDDHPPDADVDTIITKLIQKDFRISRTPTGWFLVVYVEEGDAE